MDLLSLEGETTTGLNKKPLKSKSTFNPDINICPQVKVFRDLVSEEFDTLFRSSRHQKYPCNFSQDEYNALIDIKSWEAVVKPSDKGGNIVIWPYEMYLKEAQRQLKDTSCYKRVLFNPADQFKTRYGRLLKQALDTGCITKSDYKFLTVENPKVATLYFLPKVHKNEKIPPGRPIVSGIESLTEQASRFIDYHLRKFVYALPSYTRDTLDVLTKINGVSVTPDTWLITCDVESLYTSISHELGVRAVKYFLNMECYSEFNDFLTLLLEFVLTHNFFLFDEAFYVQTRGTAMGTACAPTYANIFLGWWEMEFVFKLDQFTPHINLWLRYIDDILILWEGDYNLLVQFMDVLNDNDLNIHLTREIDKNQVNFLDLTIRVSPQGMLETDMFRKPTATNSILHYESAHLPMTINSIPKAEFLRTRRNCSSNEDYEKRAEELQLRLLSRGYSHRLVKKARRQVTTMDRQSLLYAKSKKRTDNKIRFVSRFCRQWKDIRSILNKHLNILKTDFDLDSVLGEYIDVSWRRGKNLNDLIVKSHFDTHKKRSVVIKGSFPCGHCRQCVWMAPTSEYVDKFGINHKIGDFINCTTQGVIYCIICPCHKKYIGMTKRSLRVRIYEHSRNIRNATRDKQLFKPLTSVARHFLKEHNGQMDGTKIFGICRVMMNKRGGDLVRTLQRKETEMIFLLNSITPYGMNEKNEYVSFL